MHKLRYGSTRVFIASEHYVSNADIEEIINRALENVATKENITELSAEIKNLKGTVEANRASVNDRMMREFDRQNNRLKDIHTDLRQIKEHLGISNVPLDQQSDE